MFLGNGRRGHLCEQNLANKEFENEITESKAGFGRHGLAEVTAQDSGSNSKDARRESQRGHRLKRERADPVISGFTEPCRPDGSEGVRRRSPNWFLINAKF